jgi:hypothetical protein
MKQIWSSALLTIIYLMLQQLVSAAVWKWLLAPPIIEACTLSQSVILLKQVLHSMTAILLQQNTAFPGEASMMMLQPQLPPPVMTATLQCQK